MNFTDTPRVAAKMAKKKKSGKQKNFSILLSSRGITLTKMNQSHRNANCNCNSLLQSNKPSFNSIAAKMSKKKSGQLKIFSILPSSRGVTLAKMNQSHRNANWNCSP
jgi:hypothetical protein